MSVNSEVPSIHLALQPALLDKPVNTLPPNTLQCRTLLDTFSNAMSRSKVLFSDECAIYHSARNRKVVLWSKKNPNFTQEPEHNPPHVKIWAGMTSDYLIGPYFFDGPVNAASYSAMLEKWLLPQLRDRGLLDDVWLQHDVHSHTSLFLCAMF